MKYFGDSFRFQQAANLFEKVSVREPEVSSLLARSYVGMSESYLRFGHVGLSLIYVYNRRRSEGCANPCERIEG